MSIVTLRRYDYDHAAMISTDSAFQNVERTTEAQSLPPASRSGPKLGTEQLSEPKNAQPDSEVHALISVHRFAQSNNVVRAIILEQVTITTLPAT